jgi:hypothetical protein
MFKDIKQCVGHTKFVESVQNALVVQQKQPKSYNCRVEYRLMFQENLAVYRAARFGQKELEVFGLYLFPFRVPFPQADLNRRKQLMCLSHTNILYWTLCHIPDGSLQNLFQMWQSNLKDAGVPSGSVIQWSLNRFAAVNVQLPQGSDSHLSLQSVCVLYVLWLAMFHNGEALHLKT